MSVALVLEMAASGFGDRPAVGAGSGTVTYAGLQRRARIAAGRLAASGAGHVVYLGASGVAFPVALFASACAGIPFVPVNYRVGDRQLRQILDPLERPLVIADRISLPRVKDTGHAVAERDEWLAATAAGEEADAAMTDESAIAVLLHTSGTSGRPKAAILRHRHLIAYIFGSLEFGSAGETEAALVSVPPYHVAGVSNVLSNIYTGRRIVYLESFTPGGWLATARDEAVTHAMVVPTMLARIVEELDGADAGEAGLPALRSIAYGGARMLTGVIERALCLFPEAGFVNAYGLTETSSTVAVLGPDDHRAALASDDPAVRERLRSAGRLIPGIEADVRGPDGQSVPPGTAGELWVRGDQVSGEYAGGVPGVGADGWFATRDRVCLDAEGFLFVHGRVDDTIIRGGENIAPDEIEEVLVEHPAVRMAAVVGVPDDEWGQRIAAAVVPRPGVALDTDALRDWVRTRLRSSKTPDEIVLRDTLPHTATGKLLRREVLADLQAGTSGRSGLSTSAPSRTIRGSGPETRL
jgi:acyl-CoA synthetase (AMP-forming)/AMP-acid ligase II